jgi:RNA polymerase-interacting CarD/CdnL/TRCF family regulator
MGRLMNKIVPPDQFLAEALKLLRKEVKRVKKLTPEQIEAEIAAMSPEDRRYVEHGY